VAATPTVLFLSRSVDDAWLDSLKAHADRARFVAGRAVEDLAADAPLADAIAVGSAGRALLEPVWRLAPRVRWLHSRSAGLDHMLFPELVASDVTLTNSQGVFGPGLAEFVIAAVFHFAKDLRRMQRSQALARWDPFDVDFVRGRTLGILGYGHSGEEVARLAHALGMRVVALRTRPELSRDDPHLAQVLASSGLPELLAASDYLVVLTPLTPRTRGLVGEAELRAMKAGAVLINIARGPVVREDALLRALEQGRIRGAALDVFDQEPLPPEHPFYKLENVLLSPHCADHTPGWLDDAFAVFLDNLERFKRGERLRNVVDKQRGY
jgi:phosphoglycerate dehydrogenase-like enzyme